MWEGDDTSPNPTPVIRGHGLCHKHSYWPRVLTMPMYCASVTTLYHRRPASLHIIMYRRSGNMASCRIIMLGTYGIYRIIQYIEMDCRRHTIHQCNLVLKYGCTSYNLL